MNEKQKAIIDALIRLEYAMNSFIQEALTEGMSLQVDMVNDRLHVSFPVRVMDYDQVPNDE